MTTKRTLLFLMVVSFYVSGGEAQTCTSLTADRESKTFTSPNYPSDYNNNLKICWIITSPQMKVQLRFLDFNTEPSVDYVEIRDGSSRSSSLIGKYSGLADVPDLTSTGESIYVYFQTDGSVTRRGFEIEYSLVGLLVPQNTVVKFGESAELECGPKPDSVDEVLWSTRQDASGSDTFIYRHNGDGIKVNSRYEADNASDSLVIESASADVAGIYSCIFVTDGKPTQRYSAVFNVIDSPQCTSSHDSIRGTSGTDLHCSVTYWGPMKPRLTWMVGDLEVSGEVVRDEGINEPITPVPTEAAEPRFLAIALQDFNMEMFREDYQNITCLVSFDAQDQDSSLSLTGSFPTYSDVCTMTFERKVIVQEWIEWNLIRTP